MYKTLKTLGLFSGIGGFELGFQKEGFDILAMCEIEEPCRRVLNKNFKNIKLYDDVKNINKQTIQDEIDVILGGFPCSDISNASSTKTGLNGERSGLWFEYYRIIDELRPRYAVVENVEAVRSRGLETILYNLSQIGYDAAWTTLDSQWFGTPQRRSRVYIVAVRDGIPPSTDIFRNIERSTKECKSKIQDIEKSRRWYIEENGEGGGTTAYFTCQSFTQYKPLGVSSTLLKRDHIQFRDIIIDNDIPRQTTPEERLLLQGFPIDWYDGCDLSDKQKYKFCGMNVNTVQYVAECIRKFDISLPQNYDRGEINHHMKIYETTGKIPLW